MYLYSRFCLTKAVFCLTKATRIFNLNTTISAFTLLLIDEPDPTGRDEPRDQLEQIIVSRQQQQPGGDGESGPEPTVFLVPGGDALRGLLADQPRFTDKNGNNAATDPPPAAGDPNRETDDTEDRDGGRSYVQHLLLVAEDMAERVGDALAGLGGQAVATAGRIPALESELTRGEGLGDAAGQSWNTAVLAELPEWADTAGLEELAVHHVKSPPAEMVLLMRDVDGGAVSSAGDSTTADVGAAPDIPAAIECPPKDNDPKECEAHNLQSDSDSVEEAPAVPPPDAGTDQ